jgi:hypothetical protein
MIGLLKGGPDFMQRRRLLQALSAGAAALLGGAPGRANAVDARTGAQLLRKRYASKATGQPREYFLYLPVGYASETSMIGIGQGKTEISLDA